MYRQKDKTKQMKAENGIGKKENGKIENNV